MGSCICLPHGGIGDQSLFTIANTTISTQYNQTSMVRTIEQILGMPPMNIMDATAMPMFDCFTSNPDIVQLYSPAQHHSP